MTARRAVFISGWMLVVACSAAARGQDVVRLRGEQDRPDQVLTGTVVDYTGRELKLSAAGGAVRSYPGGQVVDIQTQWVPELLEARRAVAASDYPAAIRLLHEANATETRVWVRRLIISELVDAYAATGRAAEAGDAFLTVYQSDPETPYFRWIPLSWIPREEVPRAKAEAWLAQDDSPAAVLLGASHLLADQARPQAVEALRRLLVLADRRIAALAEAQLWRIQTAAADAEAVAGWERRVDQMPESLQAGPLLTVARAWARLSKWDEASQAALRAALLHPHPRRLASEAFASAGEALVAAGREEAAATILNETIAEFPGLPAGRSAEATLREMSIHSDSRGAGAAPGVGAPSGGAGGQAFPVLPPR